MSTPKRKAENLSPQELAEYPNHPKVDDVTAMMYLKAELSSIPDELDSARLRAHKELAHLTLERKAGTPPDKAWDFHEIRDGLRKVIKEFLGNNKADPARLGNSCRTALKKI